jgi:hypothetical protein
MQLYRLGATAHGVRSTRRRVAWVGRGFRVWTWRFVSRSLRIEGMSSWEIVLFWSSVGRRRSLICLGDEVVVLD